MSNSSARSMRIDWEPLLIVFGDNGFTAQETSKAGGKGDGALHARLCISLFHCGMAIAPAVTRG
jgi:hypothetical protein